MLESVAKIYTHTHEHTRFFITNLCKLNSFSSLPIARYTRPVHVNRVVCVGCCCTGAVMGVRDSKITVAMTTRHWKIRESLHITFREILFPCGSPTPVPRSAFFSLMEPHLRCRTFSRKFTTHRHTDTSPSMAQYYYISHRSIRSVFCVLAFKWACCFNYAWMYQMALPHSYRLSRLYAISLFVCAWSNGNMK